MLQGTARLQPDSLLGIFIGKKESILVWLAQPFDFRQSLSNLSARFQRRRLVSKKYLAISLAYLDYAKETVLTIT